MHNAAADAVELAPDDRNDAHRAVVSDLVSLIEHVQTSLRLIERAIAAEIPFGGQESSADIIVPDDVSPRYMKADRRLAGLRRPSWRRPPLLHGFPQHRRFCRKRAGAFGRRRISGSWRRPSGAHDVPEQQTSLTDFLAPLTVCAIAAWRPAYHGDRPRLRYRDGEARCRAQQI